MTHKASSRRHVSANRLAKLAPGRNSGVQSAPAGKTAAAQCNGGKRMTANTSQDATGMRACVGKCVACVRCPSLHSI